MEPDPRQLVILVAEESGVESVGPVPLPSLSDVLYEPAARPAVSPRGRYAGTRPTGRRSVALALVGKRCDNCRLYAEREERCCILGRDVEVKPDMVCGYHVAGDPQLYVTSLSGEGSLTPELAGLITGPSNGTSCDSCRYYDARTDDEGMCCATASDDGSLSSVDALGCCARWRAKPDPELPITPPEK